MQHLLYEQTGSIVRLTFNRPEIRNAISSREMIDAFGKAFDRINCDQSVNVAILTGAGSAFCSGGDIGNMQRLLQSRIDSPATTIDYYRNGVQTIVEAFEQLQVPIIAAINGAAMGGGLDVACMCDLRLASEAAIFAENYVRLGIISGMGGYWHLSRIIGYPNAFEMSVTGKTINSEQALKWDLVAEVVPGEQLLPRAYEIAESIAANPAPAVRAAKRLLRAGRETALRGHLEEAAAVQAILHTTPEHREAIEAFLMKRRPTT